MSFADEAELLTTENFGITPRLRAKIGWHDFLNGKTGDLPLTRREAINITTVLLKRVWNRSMEARGLSSYQSGAALVWFWKDGLLKANKVSFVKEDGSFASRQLVGTSERYRVQWHFAVGARPVIEEKLFFVLRPTVVWDDELQLTEPEISTNAS